MSSLGLRYAEYDPDPATLAAFDDSPRGAPEAGGDDNDGPFPQPVPSGSDVDTDPRPYARGVVDSNSAGWTTVHSSEETGIALEGSSYEGGSDDVYVPDRIDSERSSVRNIIEQTRQMKFMPWEGEEKQRLDAPSSRRAGSASPANRRRKATPSSQPEPVRAREPRKAHRFDEWYKDGMDKSVASTRSSTGRSVSRGTRAVTAPPFSIEEPPAIGAELNEDGLNDHFTETDMLPLFKMLDPEVMSAHPRNVSKAKAEVFRLIREERKLRVDAVHTARAYRLEIDRLTEYSKKLAQSRAICEKMMRSARDSAMQQTAGLADKLQQSTVGEVGLRRRIDDLEYQLTAANASIASGKRETEAAEAAAARAASAHAAAMTEVRRELEEEKERVRLSREATLEQRQRAEGAEARVKQFEEDDTIPHLRSSIATLEGSVKTLTADLAAATSRGDRQTEQCSRLTASVSALQQELSSERMATARLKGEVTALESARDCAEALAKAERSARQTAEAVNRDLETQVAAQAAQMRLAEAEKASMFGDRDRLRSLHTELEALRQAVHEHSRSNMKLERALETSETRLRSATAAKDLCDKECRELQELVTFERSLRVKAEAEAGELRSVVRNSQRVVAEEMGEGHTLKHRESDASSLGSFHKGKPPATKGRARVSTPTGPEAELQKSTIASLQASLAKAEKNVDDLTALVARLRIQLTDKDVHLNEVSRALRRLQHEGEMRDIDAVFPRAKDDNAEKRVVESKGEGSRSAFRPKSAARSRPSPTRREHAHTHSALIEPVLVNFGRL